MKGGCWEGGARRGVACEGLDAGRGGAAAGAEDEQHAAERLEGGDDEAELLADGVRAQHEEREPEVWMWQRGDKGMKRWWVGGQKTGVGESRRGGLESRGAQWLR